MAAFYGTVVGNRGATSRTGSMASGIKTTAQSHKGSVNVHLYESGGQTMATIRIAEGSSDWGKAYFCGTLDELKAKLEA